MLALYSNEPVQILSYALLMLAIVALWLPLAYVWCVLFSLAVIVGAWGGVLELPAFAPLVVLILACFLLEKVVSGPLAAIARALLIVILIAVAVALGAHRLPGFESLPVLVSSYIGHSGIAYSLHLHFDKAVVGLVLLGFSPYLIRHGKEWLTLLRATWVPAVVTVVVVISLALVSGYVRFDPKWTSVFWIWAVINLLVTCVSEEAFFRGFLQRHLAQALRARRHGELVALGVCAILFGVAHYAGGVHYVLLASIAGFGYGWVYMTTRRIEAAILTHFVLNSAHFLLFSYPHAG